jgi:hypothetical protein
MLTFVVGFISYVLFIGCVCALFAGAREHRDDEDGQDVTQTGGVGALHV